MADPHLNLYMNNPTAGGTDGTVISTEDSFTAPLNFILDGAQTETQIAKLAIRAESGYKTYGNTVIQDYNDTKDRWKLSLQSDTGWADSITFTDTITNSNLIFYAQAKSFIEEVAQNDKSVKIFAQAIVVEDS